jgi:glucose/arabinose dehydrogenase
MSNLHQKGRGARYRAFLFLVTGIIASQPGCAAEDTIKTEAGTLKVETVAEGLEHPWGGAFLPDGRLLLTERPGRLRILAKDGTLSEPLAGVPKVYASGQGGLLDVALDPAFPVNHLIYLSYAEPGKEGSATVVARGQLTDKGLVDVKVIFRQVPEVSNGLHFGSRLAFSKDGKLFITLGERFQFDPAQDLANTLGKIVRIYPDGSVPPDNPFLGQKDAQPEIWSYGHRTAQGAAIHPGTGELWETEFGPFGGDELNIVKAGSNYGWPVVSWGRHYDGKEIPQPNTHPEFVDAIYHWTPVISPSGITFYTGEAIAPWRGNLLIGGLSSQAIVRLTLDGDKVMSEERIPMGARIRDVIQAPDGSVYALTDDSGKVLRLTLEKSPQ